MNKDFLRSYGINPDAPRPSYSEPAGLPAPVPPPGDCAGCDYTRCTRQHCDCWFEAGQPKFNTPAPATPGASPVLVADGAGENPIRVVLEVLEEWLEESEEADFDENDVAHLFGMLGTAGYSIVPNAALSAVSSADGGAVAEPDLLTAVFEAVDEWDSQRDAILDSEDRSELNEYLAAALGTATPAGQHLVGEATVSQWVPVAERLPAPGLPVLLTVREVSAIPGPDYKESFWVTRGQRDVPHEGKWLWRDGADGRPSYEPFQITHWQPLPKAPADASC